METAKTTDQESRMRDYLDSISGCIFSGESIGNTPHVVGVYNKEGVRYGTRRVLPQPSMPEGLLWKMAVE